MDASHGAQVRPWPPPMESSNQGRFFYVMTKMDAHDLSLAIHTLNFIQNQL
jgi:hypothetical protein